MARRRESEGGRERTALASDEFLEEKSFTR